MGLLQGTWVVIEWLGVGILKRLMLIENKDLRSVTFKLHYFPQIETVEENKTKDNIIYITEKHLKHVNL